MKNFNTFTFFNQLTAMPKRLAMVLTVLFTLGVGSMSGAETYSWTCTGSTTFSTSGSSLNGVTWKASTSGTSQGTGVSGEKCVQIAKNTGLTLETTFFLDKNITSISIQTWGSQENTFSLQDDNTQLATTTIPKSYTSNAAKITFSNVGTVKTKLVFKWESASKAFNVRSINITYEDAAPSCSIKPTVGTTLQSISTTVNSITAIIPISAVGGCSITENGLVYSTTTSTPIVGGSGCVKVTTTACGSTAANKTVTITGLNCGTSYYIRGYATNEAGTSYTNVTTTSTSDCPKYTVTLKDDDSTLPQQTAGAAITLPSREGCDGYTFAGWTASWTAPQETWTTTAPTIIAAGEYTPTTNVNLYPVYTKTDIGSGFSKYQKVEKELDDWSGKYLLSTGMYTANGEYNNNHLLRVEYTPGSVEKLDWEFTLNKVGDNSYTMLLPDGKTYLGYNSSTNFKKSESQPNNDNSFLWFPSNNGIANVGTPARKMSDGGNDIRPYSNPTSNIVYLYKRMDGGGTNYYISIPDCSTLASAVLVSIAQTAGKTKFTAGDTFKKATIIATYDDNSTKDVTELATFTGYNMSTLGDQDVTVSYTEGSVTETTTYQITVTAKPSYAITWKVNDDDAVGGSTSVTEGEKVTALPNTPEGCSANMIFVGWSNQEVSDGNKPSLLFTDIAGSPEISADVIFYAVFAEGGGLSDTNEVLLNYQGGTSSDLNATEGLSANGLGTDDYTESNAPYRVKLDNTGDYILYTNESKPYISQVYFKVKMIGGDTDSKITIKTSDDGKNYIAQSECTISGSQNNIKTFIVDINTYAKYVQLYFTKGSNIGFGPLIIYTKSSSFQNYTTTCNDESEYINVTGVTISNSELALKVGEKQTLTATIAPANATNKNLIWTSNNNSIASVGADGLVTAISAGTATITVKTEVGGFAATCAVYVTEPVTPVEGVYYELTDLADIKPTDVVLFVGKVGDKYYAMSNDGTGGKGQPLPVEVTVVGDKITTTAENVQWIISKLNDDIEKITFYSVTEEKWLCCENDNNGLRLKLNANNNTFKMTDNGYLYNNEQGRTIGIYNKQDWRSYSGVDANIKDQTFGFYVKHSSNPLISVTPDTYDFGLVEVNKSASITLTIVSEHVTDLKATITDNTNYSIGQITNAPDGNKQIKITYNPKDEKIHYATLTIVSTNASEGANFEIALLGQGVISDGAVWTLVEDVNDLRIGDKVVIAAAEYDYALSTTQNKNNRGAVAIVKDNKTILVHPEVQIITLEVGTSENSWAFNVGGGYLYADQSTENYLRTKNGKDAYGSWVMSITNGVTSIVGQGGNTRETLRFNDNNRLFSCYGDNTDQKSVAIYKKQVHIRNVTPGDYGTICIPYGSNNYTGAEFYEISWMEMDGTTPKGIWLDEVNGNLTAGKPYIFKATSTVLTVNCTGTAVATPVEGVAGLTGTFTLIQDIETSDLSNTLEGNYMISGNQFLLCPAGCWLNAYRAYIDADIIAGHTIKKAVIPGRRRVCLGENVSTGFENVTNGENTTIKVIENGQLIIIRNGEKFNAQGQRL